MDKDVPTWIAFGSVQCRFDWEKIAGTRPTRISKPLKRQQLASGQWIARVQCMAAIMLSNHPQSKDLEVYITGKTYSLLDIEIRDHVQECDACLRKAAEMLRKRLQNEDPARYLRLTDKSFQPEHRH